VVGKSRKKKEKEDGMARMNVAAFAAVGLLVLSGCSSLQFAGQKKSAIVERVSPDTFTVNFCGNAYMSQKEAEKYALQRAADLALSKGFSHFVILSKNDDSRICPLDSRQRYGTMPSSEKDISSSQAAAPFVTPNLTLTIRCFSGGGKMPEDAIDAEQYLKDNFPGLRE